MSKLTGQKITIIVGAGATIADASSIPKKQQPPLDKHFFINSNKTNKRETKKIIKYIDKIYDLNILDSEHDSLEKVMAIIYADIYDPNLTVKSSEMFRTLIGLFNRRLADTTNNLPPTQSQYLYRILSKYLKNGVSPDDITLISFNQDLQIEKILDKMDNTAAYSHLKILNFPFCYNIPISTRDVTSPTSGGANLFNIGDEKDKYGVFVLKLHGSLNWYSTHRSQKISTHAMFRSNRNIKVTRRKTIEPNMKLTGRKRSSYTLPIVVPPVNHKSSIYHNHVKQLWPLAEKKIRDCDEIIIFGYSCPELDFESTNLIQRSLRRNQRCNKISVIDPDPNVLNRYIRLINPDEIHYYPNARSFLNKSKY